MKKILFLGLLFSVNLVSLGEAVPGIVFDEKPNLLFAFDYYTEKKCVIRGFETNKRIPRESETVDLKVISETFNKYAISGSIDIVGHTDSTGSKNYNQKLSLIRANNVAILFREYGLDNKFTFKIIGKGESEPSDINETKIGRYNNRRVEIFFKDLKLKEEKNN